MTKVSTKSNRQENELDSQIIQTKNDIPKSALQSIKSALSKPSDIYKLFFLFSKKLNKFFTISRSSLILHSRQENKLKMIAMKSEKGARKGLALTLPENGSLLYKIFNKGLFHFQHYPKNSDCNFIEQKILKDKTALSMAILPIIQDNINYGLICLSSPDQDAFVPLENGLLDEILDGFGKNLIQRIPSTNI
ncbi:MAG: hypothetical protein GY865_01340 [candidate division Zixibacteria bacterium]|nr:hypothetical protein [candidate division Zixibacteria bacterium]